MSAKSCQGSQLLSRPFIDFAESRVADMHLLHDTDQLIKVNILEDFPAGR